MHESLVTSGAATPVSSVMELSTGFVFSAALPFTGECSGDTVPSSSSCSNAPCSPVTGVAKRTLYLAGRCELCMLSELSWLAGNTHRDLRRRHARQLGFPSSQRTFRLRQLKHPVIEKKDRVRSVGTVERCRLTGPDTPTHHA